jgi:hypothetical protein
MPEPTDAVLPILSRIQGDLVDTRRVLGRHTELLEKQGEKLESIEGYLTYELGMSTRARADIQSIQTEIKVIKKRLAALERSSSKNGPKRK